MLERIIIGTSNWLQEDRRRFDVVVALATVAGGALIVLGAPERDDLGWPDVATGVVTFVLVLVRRRWPISLTVIALVATIAYVAALDRPSPTIVALLVLVATAAVRLERWQSIAFGLAIGGTLYGLSVLGNDADFAEARAVIGIAWTAMAIGIGDATRSYRRYRESVGERLRSTVVAAEARTRQQVSEERLAIARELHDLLAHNLSVMNVQTGAALHLLRADPDQAEVSLIAARDAGRGVLDELRELLTVLRQDDDTETSSLPAIDELPDLLDTMRSAGLAVEWHRIGRVRPVAPAVSLAAFRICQEALTNAAKHGAGAAELTTEWDLDTLMIRVTNDIGARLARSDDIDALAGSGGHGLIGMRERATTNGGTLSIGDDDPHRFVVEARLPTAVARRDDPAVPA
ncbi:MAG: histidine kinase [Actinomycetota bacterium]